MQPQGDLLSSILPLVVLFLIFYFLIIRPQKKQQQAHKNMLEALKKGDKIITNGGLIAEIQKVEEDFLSIKLSDDSTAKLAKDYVASLYDNSKN